MFKRLLVLVVLAMVVGCATQQTINPPNTHSYTTKYDGLWISKIPGWTGKVNVKYGVISGYLRHNRWRGDLQLNVNGYITSDSQIHLDTLHHPDANLSLTFVRVDQKSTDKYVKLYFTNQYSKLVYLGLYKQ